MVIPTNFEEWQVCIEKKCDIPLTLEFAQQRLSIYEDENLPETQRFIQLYGQEHLQRIRTWFAYIVEEKRKA